MNMKKRSIMEVLMVHTSLGSLAFVCGGVKVIHKKTDRAEKIRNTKQPIIPPLKIRLWFAHKYFKRSDPDYTYWEKLDWHGKEQPWRM